MHWELERGSCILVCLGSVEFSGYAGRALRVCTILVRFTTYLVLNSNNHDLVVIYLDHAVVLIFAVCSERLLLVSGIWSTTRTYNAFPACK